MLISRAESPPSAARRVGRFYSRLFMILINQYTVQDIANNIAGKTNPDLEISARSKVKNVHERMIAIGIEMIITLKESILS